MPNSWISAIDKNEIVGTLFLDLSKAFDLVNHDILLQTLSMYGLHNNVLEWFMSYLNSKTHLFLFLGNNLPL